MIFIERILAMPDSLILLPACPLASARRELQRASVVCFCTVESANGRRLMCTGMRVGASAAWCMCVGGELCSL